MSNIWFTSDLHLGHPNITGPEVSKWKDGFRTFKSVPEMDTELLRQLNSRVAQDDILYFLGDFTFKGSTSIKSYRNLITCQDIRFVKGNHDKRRDIVSVFGHCYDYIEEDLLGIRFCMMHYAMRVWNKSHRGSLHLYGHSHANLEDAPYGRSMDVGVDAAYKRYGEYRPFSLKEVVDILAKRPLVLIDHHGTSKDKSGGTRVQS